MEVNREIPGYYYDSSKRKYFRIEDSRTAPAQAAWSSQNVKRRAVQEEEDNQRRERLRRTTRRVKRVPVRDVPLLGGLLARESGEVRGSGGGGGGGGAVSDYGETLLRAWAGGLRRKGELTPGVRTTQQGQGTVSAMWVRGSDEHDGSGVAYTVVGERYLGASFVPRDAEDRIDSRNAWHRHPRFSFVQLHYSEAEPAITDMTFHEPSRTVLLAYGNGSGGVVINHLMPEFVGAGQSIPPWQLAADGTRFAPREATLPSRSVSVIHSLRPAPRGSPLTCIAGTDRGIIKLQDYELTWLTPPPPSSRARRRQLRRQGTHHDDLPPWQGDVLSVDFALQNPVHLVLAGTRSSHACLLDLRVPPHEWPTATPSQNNSTMVKHASSVAHIRSVGEHEVLAAGPRSAMSVYDLRFLRHHSPPTNPAASSDGGGRSRSGGNWTRPVVQFPSYRNEAHLQIGLDVLTEPAGYGSKGLVAAAHDDGTVGVYSLRDGSRVQAGDVDSIRVADAVVRSMMWVALPGERHPGLWVGEGGYVRKYSFWA